MEGIEFARKLFCRSARSVKAFMAKLSPIETIKENPLRALAGEK